VVIPRAVAFFPTHAWITIQLSNNRLLFSFATSASQADRDAVAAVQAGLGVNSGTRDDADNDVFESTPAALPECQQKPIQGWSGDSYVGCQPSLRGGIALLADSACSLGFIATAPSGFGAFALTAGHCYNSARAPGVDLAHVFGSAAVPLNSSQNEAKTLGAVQSVRWDTKEAYSASRAVDDYDDQQGFDFALVKVTEPDWAPNALITTWKSDQTTRNLRWTITKTLSPGENKPVCASFARSGKTKCGKVLEKNLNNKHARASVDFCGIHGDSGSPVWWGHAAVGLFVTIDTKRNGCIGEYQGIGAAEAAGGFAVLNKVRARKAGLVNTTCPGGYWNADAQECFLWL
jgi:hypothetical protein